MGVPAASSGGRRLTLIYKILSRTSWEAARTTGVYSGSEVDLRDGFIHFSTAAQTAETARRHFLHAPDLLVLTIDAEGLGSDLRWEPSRGGELFPHLYGPLPIDRVTAVRAAPLDADGVPDLGELAR